jgi:preprotein translocase subunit SecG
MVYYAIGILHIIVCIILVLVVLLQSGKGADLAGAFGGGATQTAFGSRGPASFLSKMTTIAAVIFMVTCIVLSMIATKTESKSVLESKKTTSQPAKKAPAASQPSNQAAPRTPEQIQKEIEALNKKNQQPATTPANTQPPPADNKSGKK